MKEHVNIPMYKTQNGWTTKGWRKITKQFNEKFPLAHFTKQQIQSKEKELKENYKIIRDARKNSDASWNESLCMIIAKPKIWDEMIEVSHFSLFIKLAMFVLWFHSFKKLIKMLFCCI